MTTRQVRLAGWIAVLAVAGGVRLWNALEGPRMWGYDAWGHVAYALYLDLYQAVPWADQGWSYFHPPLHYLIGWGLAQARSGELLMRGLMLWGSLASLLTAGLAAWLARAAFPGRPGLALLAFASVACLPVQYFMSPMPGNEMTATLLGAGALASFVASELSVRRSLAADGVTGVLLGLGLLTKFSGLVTAVALLAALGVRACLAPAPRAAVRGALARAAWIAGIAFLLAAPYYARNVSTFGTPFELSRGYPLVADVERGQPPGVRRLRDFVTISPRIWSDPNPLAPHMYRSVWGSVYVNTWADLYRESDVARALEAERVQRRSTGVLALLGLLPTGLALLGAGLALRDVTRGRRRALWTAPLLLSLGTLGSFALFAWRVPIWSALKASYLLGLSLPFALFLARACEELLERGRRGACALVCALLAGIALATSLVALDGFVLPRRADAPASGAVSFYFGEYAAARRVYERLIAGAAYPVPWLDNLAAVELADGQPERARELYARAVALELARGRFDVYRHGQLAVATALTGDLAGAQKLLSEALERTQAPELLANRGAIAVVLGDADAAAVDLRGAIAQAPQLAVARLNQARLLASQHRPRDAELALSAAAQAACQPPRGYPYGVGTGEVLEWGVGRRWLLRLEKGGLVPVLPVFFREACAALSQAARPGAQAAPG